MNIETYLAALDAKLREVEGLVVSTSIQREIDANLGMGFIKGSMPPERKGFR
jgi:hypothetical protein